MPLPKFKSRDDIPEAVRDGYVEVNGEWVPDVEDVTNLKSAHEAQKTKNRELADKLRELERKLKGAKDGLTDEEIAARRAEIDAEVNPLREQLTQAQQQLRSLRLDGNVKKMLADAGANPKRLDALFRLLSDRFDLSESGTPILKDKPTADLAQYLKNDVAKEYPELYLSTAKGGADMPGNNGGNGNADLAKLVESNPMALLQMANATT